MKKIVCIGLTLLMLFSSTNVFARRSTPAANKVYERYYTFGEEARLVDAEDFISDKSTDAVAVDNYVQISAGGSAVWGFYLPYASRSVTILYEGSGDITIKTDENTYNPHTLSGSGEDTIVFGENLGYSQTPQWRSWPSLTWCVLQDYVEHPGEKEVTITSSDNLKITELKFEKELTAIHYYSESGVERDPSNWKPDVSDYEMEMTSTVVMHENSSVIVVSGGRRYIDNDNIYTRPLTKDDGTHYLPIETLAKALGYYYEDIPSHNYALMRSEWHEVVMNNGNVTVAEGTAKPVSADSTDMFLKQNGETYAQVEYFGELLGKTVGYNDRLIVIDDKYTVRDILENDEFYQFAYDKVAPFIEEKAAGTTYHVSQSANASDENEGTLESPFLTIEKAAYEAKAGDTVIVHAGTYRETIEPVNNGEAGAPITFKAAENEEVFISAADILDTSNYTIGEKGEYVIDMPMDLGIGRNQIYINNVSMLEARYPDDGERHAGEDILSNLWGIRGEIYKTAGDYKTFFSETLLDQEDDYWVGGTYVGTFGWGYYTMTGLIESSTKGSFKVSDKYREQQSWTSLSGCVINNSATTPNYGMIVGHINALNMPGEWVRTDDGKLHIILPEGKSIDSVQIEAKSRQLIANLKDKKFINIEGFSTIGGSVTMGDEGEMCMLNGLDMKYINHYTLNADGRNGYIDVAETAYNGRYYNNREPGAPQRGEVGIYLGGTDEIVVNCKMDQAAGAAIYMTGVYSYIENNKIDQCGYMGSYATAIHADTLAYAPKCTPRGGYAIYNNTISTCSQSAIDFCKSEMYRNYRDIPYLPSEIAYNDVHDCNLTSVDAGAMYANGVNVGFDKRMTNVHHNYVYKTIDSRYGNAGDVGLFWDGNAQGFDSYENMIFTTGSEGITNLIQQATATAAVNPARAYERIWNNGTHDYISVDKTLPVADGIGAEFFSENRPFFAGTTLDRESAYLNNYNRVINNKSGITYPAVDANISEGVVLNENNGYAQFSADDQYIHFEDVDFGNGSNEILINYFSDSNWSYDNIEVYIGDSMESYSRKLSFKTPDAANDCDVWYPNDPPNRTYTCSTRKKFAELSGVHDVWIKVKKYYSIAIGGISVYSHTQEKYIANAEDWAWHTYPSLYTDYNKDNKKATDGFMGKAQPALITQMSGVYGVRSTYAGHTARYANQEITQDLTKDKSLFVLAAGSGGASAYQLINVYLCEPTAEYTKPAEEDLVASIREGNTVWNQTTPIGSTVLRDVEKGVYDIYVEFSDEGGASLGRTSNILEYGFIKDSVDPTEYTATKAPKLASTFVKNKSIQNAQMPFSRISYDRINSTEQKLMNTLPGTTAAYSDVLNSEEESTSFAFKYYVSDKSYANQPITVRVNRIETTYETVIETVDGVETEVQKEVEKEVEISRGTFVTEACEKDVTKIGICELDTPVPDGQYEVYLDFGGWYSGKNTCQLYWFGFSNAPANTKEDTNWISGTLKNQNNEFITYSNLANAQSISVDGCFANFDSANPPVAMIAFYTEDNYMLDLKFLDVTQDETNDKIGIISGTFVLSEDVKANVSDARIFVWENLETIKPIYNIPGIK